MTAQTVLGLWAPIGAGKTTVAELLVQRHGYRRYAFAGPLKELAGHLFDFDASQLYGDATVKNAVDPRGLDPLYWAGVRSRVAAAEPRLCTLFADRPVRLAAREVMNVLEGVVCGLQAERATFSPRVALQRFGTEFGRELWPSVWTNALVRQIEHDAAPRVVVDDVRFPNEAELITGLRGYVVWIAAGRRVPVSDHAGHASEATYAQAAPYLNYVLDNNADLETLARCIDALIADIARSQRTAGG